MTFTEFVLEFFKNYSVDMYSFYIPLGVLVFTPPITKSLQLIRRRPRRMFQDIHLLGWFAFFWIVSIKAPNIPITGSDSVTTHLMAGLILAPVLYVYIVRLFDWQEPAAASGRFIRLMSAVALFALANEAAELCLVVLGIAKINLADAPVDLAFGLLGGCLAFLIKEGWLRVNRFIDDHRENITNHE